MAVPFTTPILGGTRVRAAQRSRIELLTRNPADGRSVYVTPWSEGGLPWRPTLHDRVLIQRIATLGAITPATILQASRATAAEGLAGERAMAAAQAAKAADDSVRAMTCYRLLVDLIRQVAIDPDVSTAILDPNRHDLDALARRTNDWIATQLHQPRTWAATALESLGIILANNGESGRNPRLIAMLRQTHDDIVEWSRNQFRGERISCAYMITGAAELALSMATKALTDTRRATEDMIGLLRSWSVNPAAVQRLASRPEWLLDGWEQVCLIWNYAQDDSARYAALVEVVEYVPIMPKEVNDWSGSSSDLVLRRPGMFDTDWRNGATMFDLIARNEQLRAIAC